MSFILPSNLGARFPVTCVGMVSFPVTVLSKGVYSFAPTSFLPICSEKEITDTPSCVIIGSSSFIPNPIYPWPDDLGLLPCMSSSSAVGFMLWISNSFAFPTLMVSIAPVVSIVTYSPPAARLILATISCANPLDCGNPLCDSGIITSRSFILRPSVGTPVSTPTPLCTDEP